ncbi:sodium-coupled neutral amino acid transporter 7-like [Guaruba guarouba]
MGVHRGEQHALANPNCDPLVMSKVVMSTLEGQKGLDLDYRFPCSDALASPGREICILSAAAVWFSLEESGCEIHEDGTGSSMSKGDHEHPIAHLGPPAVDTGGQALFRGDLHPSIHRGIREKGSTSLSVIGTWYVTAVIIIKYIWPNKKLVPVEIPTSPSTWTAVFNAMPTICFGFQCHMSSVPVFNSMKQPEVKTWVVVVMVAMVITPFVYTGTGVCGFLTFGVGVEQDVLMSYPSNDIPVALAQALIILCVLTSYPILHFCGRKKPRRCLLQAISCFLLILLLALFISDTGKVISVIGGLAACFIFIFPGRASWDAVVV